MNTFSYDTKTRNRFQVVGIIKIPINSEKLWKVVTAPGNLENIHPYCKFHSKNILTGVGSSDNTEFYSGKGFKREVIEWDEGKSFIVKLCDDTKKITTIGFSILTQKSTSCSYKIIIKTDAYKKIPRPIWPLFAKWLLVPSYKKYLYSLLNGLLYYCETGKKVTKNQFGSHKKFST